MQMKGENKTERINVMRMYEKEVCDIQLGDKILVPLEKFGEFTATAHKITDKGVLFIFDDYVARHQMNSRDTNKGGFEKSDLKKWLDTVLFEAFPDWLKGRIEKLSIPTVGELFGHEDEEEWDNEFSESDTDEQLPLMKDRRNQVAYSDNDLSWGWLRNAMKKETSTAHFASVNYYGFAGCTGASFPNGVRPEFWLVK